MKLQKIFGAACLLFCVHISTAQAETKWVRWKPHGERQDLNRNNAREECHDVCVAENRNPLNPADLWHWTGQWNYDGNGSPGDYATRWCQCDNSGNDPLSITMKIFGKYRTVEEIQVPAPISH